MNADNTVIPRQSDAVANAANVAAIDSVAGESRYRHVVAWGKFLGFTPETVRSAVELAAVEGAPIDAIQKIDGRWLTLADIQNDMTRQAVCDLAATNGGN